MKTLNKKIVGFLMRSVGFRRFVIPIQCLIAVFILTFMQGCSVYCAARQPGPCYVERVKVGSSQPEVTAVLGNPKTSGVVNGQKVYTYEFADGLPTGSKSRIVLYVAGDVFTICLAEVIFWPMELAVLKAREGTAVVTYDSNMIVTELSVTKRNGSPWVYRETKQASAATSNPDSKAKSGAPVEQSSGAPP